MNDRKDSWNPSDDLLLSRIVLEHIRTGGTQLKAFEEVTEALERTSAACGFRWNSTVRHNYVKEIGEAKLVRHSLKSKPIKKDIIIQDIISDNHKITFDKVISYLLNFKQEYEELNQKLVDQDKIIQEYDSKSQETNTDPLSDDMRNFFRILGKSSIFDSLPRQNDKEPAI